MAQNARKIGMKSCVPLTIKFEFKLRMLSYCNYHLGTKLFWTKIDLEAISGWPFFLHIPGNIR